MSDRCDVYWGSHGCMFAKGHDGPCICECCDCPDHAVDNTKNDDPWVICVGAPPYYGPETEFYGDDVEARGLPRLRP